MVISIDIGTSYSSVCLLNQEGKAEPVEIATGISIYGGKYSLPSAVFVDDSGKVLVGQAAMNSRKRMPQNFRSEFKRDLGQNIPIVLGNRSFLPEDLYAELFRHMKECAKKRGMEEVEKAYITYPASFGKVKQEKIEQAARKAGLFDTELIDEPTAAAMCYGEKGTLKDGDVLLVYDFGGGTFDAAVLRYKDGEYEPLAPAAGIEHCGGIDIDRAVYSDMYSRINPELLKPLQENKLNRLRFEGQLAELAVKVKHHLSTAECVQEDIAVGFDVLEYHLRRDELENMIVDLVMQTINCCEKILKNAGITVREISSILLVGGTSKVPLVQKMMQSFATDIPVYADSEPDLAIVKGVLLMGLKNPAIQFKLGWNFVHDNDIEPNYNKAREWYEKAAEQGYAAAQYELGELYCKGLGVLPDYDKAKEWYEKAAEQGYAAAQYELGELYGRGLGRLIDYDKAKEWYEKAAEQGYAAAQCRLGTIYYIGLGGMPDYIKAAEWYRKAAIQGSSEAQAGMGRIYLTGDGVEQDLYEAEGWLKLSAEQENLDAMYGLGLLYNAKKIHPLAEYWWKKAGEQGYVNAQLQLGLLYAETYQDDSAEYWWKKAAEQETDVAEFNLGRLYERNGRYEEAERWYKTAAEHGYMGALYNLGSIYFNIKKDMDKARFWWRKAAEQGDEKAKGMLNIIWNL